MPHANSPHPHLPFSLFYTCHPRLSKTHNAFWEFLLVPLPRLPYPRHPPPPRPPRASRLAPPSHRVHTALSGAASEE